MLFLGCDPSTSSMDENSKANSELSERPNDPNIPMEHYNMWMPVNRTLDLPCANGGVGESVDFSGENHFVVRTWIDRNGGYHFKEAVNLKNLIGFGQDTGDKYHVTGTTEEQLYAGPGELPVTYTILNPGIGIGPDPNVRFTLNVSTKVTINKNGEFTVYQERVGIECVDIEIE
jgi:hypothetical protein